MPDAAFGIFVGVSIVLQVVCVGVVLARFPRFVERWNREVRLDRNALLDSSDLTKLLDQFLLGDPWYDFLRRVSIIAPLAGVVYTAIQFGMLEKGLGVGAGTDFGDLSVVSKLYEGVAAGAAVAGLNQLMLFVVQMRWRKYRMSADLKSGSTNVNSTAARFSTGLQNLLAETQDRCSRMLDEMHARTSENTRVSSERLESAASMQLRLGTELTATFRQRLDEALRHATEEAVQAVAPIHRSIVEHGRLLGKVMAETGRLHSDLAGVLELSRERGDTLSSLVDRLTGTVQQLESSFSAMASTEIPLIRQRLSEFSADVQGMGASVKLSVDELNSSSEQLSSFMGAVGTAGGEIAKASAALRDSAAFFGTECRDAAASLQLHHSDMKSNMQGSLEAMRTMLELNSQVSGTLKQASASTSVLREVTDRMGEVSKSLSQSTEMLSESGLPRALSLMDSFGEDVGKLRDQVAITTESVTQASLRLSSFYEKLQISGDELQELIKGEREMLRTSVNEMLKFNNEFPQALQQVIAGGRSIRDASQTLEAVSSQLSVFFAELIKTGIPEARNVVQGFSANVMDFASQVREGTQSVTAGAGAFSTFLSSIGTSGSALSTVATQVRESTGSFSKSVSDAGTSLQTAVGRLDAAIEGELVVRLRALHSELENGLQQTRDISVQISPAMQQLSQAASAASGTLQGIGKVSSDVSGSVQGMATTVTALTKSLEDQKAVLAKWGSIVESVPKALKDQTDGVLKDMIAQFGQIIRTMHDQSQHIGKSR